MTTPVLLNIPDTTDWLSVMSEPELAEIDPDVLHRCEAMAWTTLAAMCAYRLGVCATEVRPVAACRAPWGSWFAQPAIGDNATMGALPLQTIGGIFTPYITQGMWVNACGCGPEVTCNCDGLSVVYLPGPVGEVEWVKIDGAVIDPTRYRTDEGYKLVSTDPDLKWPGRPNMMADADETGSFVVRYWRGAAPNELSNYTAAVLAKEFVRARNGKQCRLPIGTTGVVQRGLTINLGTDYWTEIKATIPEVAALVNQYNPFNRKLPSRVSSPEARHRQARKTTWSTP